jgi:hypothetical protein
MGGNGARGGGRGMRGGLQNGTGPSDGTANCPYFTQTNP